jgi:hypothetical protein
MDKYTKKSDMEDKIFDIVTDLIRKDITKNEAIDELLILHSVRKNKPPKWNKVNLNLKL